jgi:hypothetical protein
MQLATAKGKIPYLSQFLQNRLIYSALFEIDSGAVDNICDDLLVNISDLSV